MTASSSLRSLVVLALAIAAAWGCGGPAGPGEDASAAARRRQQTADASAAPAGPAGRRLRYTEERAACANYNRTRNPHFGDVHVHTSRSLDAGIQDTRTTPDQAYRFAKGERIGIQPWRSLGESGDAGLAHMIPAAPASGSPPRDATPLRTLQLGRPLDFAMVSDHAEFFGEVRICAEPGVYEDELSGPLGGTRNRGYASRRCANLRNDPFGQFVGWNFDYLGAPPGAFFGDGIPRYSNVCGRNGEHCLAAAESTWQEAQQAADAAYDKTPDCEFTAFIGYEYTSTPLSDNMHRNVLFRNANVPELPVSSMEAKRPELLWAQLDQRCSEPDGCEVITIPHNSNMSGNRMFRRNVAAIYRRDFDAPYAHTRQRYEPLIEIYQHKGDSECRKENADELCGFEKFPFNNLIADRFGGFLTSRPSEENFVRFALKTGLAIQGRVGVNPFKYGIVGSTDTHLGTPGAVNEVNFPGHGGAGASNNDLVVSSEEPLDVGEPPEQLVQGLTDSIAFSSGGLAVVWSEENSRDYLFDAMQRRETYATSGPRMTVRFFGSWDYPEAMCDAVRYDPTAASLTQGAFVRTGYENGVPMGSDLPESSDEAARPVFAVAALKDPGFDTERPGSDLHERSTPLQQLQIIKGWVDARGKKHEQVVSVAGDPENGSSVDLDTCEPRGPGADALCAVWRDDSFAPEQRAFYYARVVENPTCRWSWLQCNAYARDNDVDWGDACANQGSLPKGYRSCCLHRSLSGRLATSVTEGLLGTYPEAVQERAWTSPIWYEPR